MTSGVAGLARLGEREHHRHRGVDPVAALSLLDREPGRVEPDDCREHLRREDVIAVVGNLPRLIASYAAPTAGVIRSTDWGTSISGRPSSMSCCAASSKSFGS